MFVYKQLRVSFDYSLEYDNHNHDLVGYVIQRYPRKVVRTSVLTRESVPHWYEDVRTKFSEKTHVILIGTVSILGEIDSLQDVDNTDEGKDKDRIYFQPSATKSDPNTN